MAFKSIALVASVLILFACGDGGGDGETTVDSVAPIISALTTTFAATTASIQLDSNEAGTAYYIVQQGGSTPTAEQVKDKTGNGGTIADSGSLTVSVGSNTVNLTNLTAETTYTFYVVVEDSAGNQSTIGSAEITTTSSIDTTAPILSSISATPSVTSAILQFSSDEAGVVYFLAQIGGSEPTAAQVKSGGGNGGTVASTGSSAVSVGVNTVNLTGLVASTSYTLYIMVEDVARNPSIVGSAPITTLAPSGITSFELLDPTPGTGDLFGRSVVVLSNGNIVVTDPKDSSVASNSGAVHLYDPLTQKLIASIYGDVAGDQLGQGGITALPNNNYVISSLYDDEGGIVDAGSIRLMDGTTGAQIGSTIAGDNAYDYFQGVTALSNNNYVIVASADDVGGIANAGSVRLVNGATGVQIGSTIAGDNAGDVLGLTGVTVLANNNYTISSTFANSGGLNDVGSVILVNGTTGAKIGNTITGDSNFDGYGTFLVTALVNNNFVIIASEDDVDGIVDAGSARLLDGETGLQIGSTITGDFAGDKLGQVGATALSNNNYVISSPYHDEGGITDVGAVRLVNGSTGIQIGSTIFGDTAGDALALSIALTNNNYVIYSVVDDEGGIVNAGSARLVDGTTGAQIGSTISGDTAGDTLGFSIALTNNNYVISATSDDEGGIVNAGSARLVDGTTGAQIGNTMVGDNEGDQLGRDGGVTALPNNNYVIATRFDTVNGIVNAGSVRLVDGTTGAQIGSTIAGDDEDDQIGYTRLNSLKNTNIGITALSNNNVVIISEFDSEGGIIFAGSVILVNGTTGAQIGSTIFGSTYFDMSEATVTESTTGDFFILNLSLADNNGRVDSGLVRLIAQ